MKCYYCDKQIDDNNKRRACITPNCFELFCCQQCYSERTASGNTYKLHCLQHLTTITDSRSNTCNVCDRKFKSSEEQECCLICRKTVTFREWRCENYELYRGECISNRCFSFSGAYGCRPEKDTVVYIHAGHKWIKVISGEPWISKHSRKNVYDLDEERELIQSARYLKALSEQQNDLVFGY